MYVQAATGIAGLDIRELSFWLKGLERDHVTIRVIDSNGRCHQFSLRTESTSGWQRIAFPLESYFANQGTTAGAATSVIKYESWGGQKEEQGWKGPARSLVILIGPDKKAAQQIHTVWINNVTIIPKLVEEEPSASKAAGISETIRLDETI